MPAVIDFDAITPKLIGDVAAVLRENSQVLNFVNKDYSGKAAEKGEVVNVPLPVIPAVTDVVAGKENSTLDDAADLSYDNVQVPMDSWKKVTIQFTDKKKMEFMEGGVSDQVNLAGIALAEYIDQVGFQTMSRGLNLLSNVPSPVSGPVVIPSDPKLLFEARRLLNENKIPLMDRTVALRPAVSEKFLIDDSLLRADYSGRPDVLREAFVGRVAGFNAYETNNVYNHTAGAITSTTPVASAAAIGATSITVTDGTLTGTVKAGDHIQIAGFAYPFVITADATAAANSITLSISPKLTAALSGGEAVTFIQKSGHRNLAFYRDSLVFVNRPLMVDFQGGSQIATWTDPMSGISLRVERMRVNKAEIWELDILFGMKVLRPNAGVQILDI